MRVFGVLGHIYGSWQKFLRWGYGSWLLGGGGPRFFLPMFVLVVRLLVSFEDDLATLWAFHVESATLNFVHAHLAAWDLLLTILAQSSRLHLYFFKFNHAYFMTSRHSCFPSFPRQEAEFSLIYSLFCKSLSKHIFSILCATIRAKSKILAGK